MRGGRPGRRPNHGNPGDDTLDGERGRDLITGNAGVDDIDGGRAATASSPGPDNDTIDGGPASRRTDSAASGLHGGLGNDVSNGGVGRDFMSGGRVTTSRTAARADKIFANPAATAPTAATAATCCGPSPAST